ncbi:hypothetical protein KCP70_13020 [Salmonella enterica subsp. enterica]|nr:hypothetical protein KCP70_13020 [Salmonella enterica subsp. enterica]
MARAQRRPAASAGQHRRFYVPLISQTFCANDCTYFVRLHELTASSVRRWMRWIFKGVRCYPVNPGFEHLLLVTGEHQAKVGMYLLSPSFTGYPPSISSRRWKSSLSQEKTTRAKRWGSMAWMVYQEQHEGQSMHSITQRERNRPFLAAGNADG